MDGKFLDQMYGKHYDLPVFENDLVRVESVGRCIRVGIKDCGVVFSWWEPRYPFFGNQKLPDQRGWAFRVITPSENKTMAFFSKDGINHCLTLICTDPGKHPMPIEVKWVTLTAEEQDRMMQELQKV
jgi:hypothetical protein